MEKDIQKVQKIINEYKDRSNKDLIFVMDHLKEDFEFTKQTLLKLTEHLDEVENAYNKMLAEFNKRTKQTTNG